MNYIKLINDFWLTRRRVRLSSNEADLYYFLMHESNIRDWENPFECANGLITSSIGITEKTLIEVRNRLQQKGLISFENGIRRKKSPVYTLLYCNKVSKEVSSTVSKRVSKTVCKPVNSLYKQNKTKPNNSKSHSSATANDEKSTLIFWKKFILVWNEFYLEKLENDYQYLAKDFGNFKKIHGFLKKRIESKNKEFTEKNLMETFQWFLKKAWDKDEWLRQNFTVSNVLSQFNQIVNESKTKQKANEKYVEANSNNNKNFLK